MSRKSNEVHSANGERLRSFIARIERLEEDKAAVAEDIKEVYAEARGVGFDTKIIRLIIREKKMGHEKAEEERALLDLYKAALGMLDGTPLGRSAIERLQKKPEPEEGDDQLDIEDAVGAQPGEEETPEPEEQDPFNGITPDEARNQGRNASTLGEDVTKNPFPARDVRRAAWEEGWCQNAGSDGMEIPAAWQRTKKEKKPDEKKGGEA